jgi:two-component system CitB family response regulator
MKFMDKLSVVIAEDDSKIAEIQSRFIDKIEGFEVVGIGNTIAESVDIIDVFQPDLVLLDVFFPDGNGVDLLWKVRRLYKNTDVIFITAAKEVGTLQEAIRGGAFDYILKPMTFSRFESTLRKFSEHRSKLKKVINLDQSHVDQIIHPAQGAAQTDIRIPKSIDPLTLEKVQEEVNKLDDKGVNAEDMGSQIGISRTTARRYLEFLVSKGAVKPSLVYGSVGRPERLYYQVSRKY